MTLTRKFLCLLTIGISSFLFAQKVKNEIPKLVIGGALRFNYNLSTWKKEQQKRGGDFGFDVFRINTKATLNKLKLDAEYRFYSKGFGGGMLKHGWIEYNFSEKSNLQIGLTQVPFGITPYSSNNWFLNINYYLGLEDDYDMGIKYHHKSKNLEYYLAFFKNAEELKFGNNSDASNARYSYDLGSIDIDGDGILDQRNKEINQFNGKINYLVEKNKTTNQFGVSTEYGQIYNLETKKTGQHYAFAIHHNLKFKNFETKAQITKYKYDSNHTNTQLKNVITLTAFGAPYLIASEATTYTLGLSYNIPVNWKPISNIQVYNDFGYMDKKIIKFKNSLMNTIGALITAGNIYTYIDFAAGKNQPWLGKQWTNALSSGSNKSKWEMRFNINIGYYF